MVDCDQRGPLFLLAGSPVGLSLPAVYSRMVTLAQSSPSRRSASALQSKTATVMLEPDSEVYIAGWRFGSVRGYSKASSGAARYAVTNSCWLSGNVCAVDSTPHGQRSLRGGECAIFVSARCRHRAQVGDAPACGMLRVHLRWKDHDRRANGTSRARHEKHNSPLDNRRWSRLMHRPLRKDGVAFGERLIIVKNPEIAGSFGTGIDRKTFIKRPIITIYFAAFQYGAVHRLVRGVRQIDRPIISEMGQCVDAMQKLAE